MVVELLCDGKTPADLPFQTFDNGIATINTETVSYTHLDVYKRQVQDAILATGGETPAASDAASSEAAAASGEADSTACLLYTSRCV